MPNESTHHYSYLIDIFSDCFRNSYDTVLVAGDDEPYYQPDQAMSRIKWCLRTAFLPQRYTKPRIGVLRVNSVGSSSITAIGMNPMGVMQQQREFEQVERKPQALEWLFSLCAGFKFDVSVDNLSGVEVDRYAFRKEVAQQLESYLETDLLPPRAKTFAKALCRAFNCEGCCQMIKD